MAGERTVEGIRNSADLVYIAKELERLDKRILRLEGLLWKVAIASVGSTAVVTTFIQSFHNS